MLENTINLLEKSKCTGCSACFNRCPVEAIHMEDNGEGFLYPKIDAKVCISCGQCKTHCPELNREEMSNVRGKDPVCYAMMSSEEIRVKSSSGGMFTILANYVLEKDGYVCGAAFSSDYKTVSHIVISKKEDLGLIRGSKYVQSCVGNTLKDLENYLKEGKYVLFTGCPCQVAGFKRFLGKDYKNLITADIICHGVPSPAVYEKYINEKSNGKKLIKVDFREKSYWGWGTATSLFFEDGSTYHGDVYSDSYWIGFLGGLITRKCCGECQYTNFERTGDFTIGDFWGVSEIKDTLTDGKGTSLVMVNNPKAKHILKQIRQECVCIEQVDTEAVKELAKTRNGQLLHPTQSHWARSRFFELIRQKSFEQSFDYAYNNRYDVGIVGWWYNENYGGTLTYFALNKVLEQMGLSVLMIAKCSPDKNYQPLYNSVPYRFAMKNYHISKNYTPDKIGVLNNHCKAFISGSDQLFNPTLWTYSGPQYFLDFVKPKNKRISYASSFGNGFSDPDNLKNRMGYWLHRFDAISVREDYGVDICKDIFGLESQKVMDPVFLCDVKEYEKQAEKTGMQKTEDYVLSFLLDPGKEKSDAVRYLENKFQMKSVNLMNALDFESNMKKMDLDNMKPDIDIEEWLFWYKNADFVITDSFHGTCFAIIFRKKFISIANYQRGEKRFISLLSEMGLMNRLVYDLKELNERPDLYDEIDYDRVFEKINPKIRDSYKWLENAIKQPVEKPVNIFDMLNSEIERLKELIQLNERNK